MKHKPQDILEYLHWPENNFGNYFWDLRELVIAEIERQEKAHPMCGFGLNQGPHGPSANYCPTCGRKLKEG